MQDLNQGTIVGRLATDPELRSLPSGMSICNFRFAFNTSRKNQATGEYEDVGNFIDVKVWGKQGENVASTQSKGKRVGVTFRLEIETWEAEGGGKRSKPVLVADRVQYLDSRDASGGSAGTEPARSAPAEDDDIPF